MAGAWQVRAPPSFRATRAWHLAAPAKQSDSRRASGAFFAQSSVGSRSGAYEVAPFTMSCLRRALCWSLAFSSSVWWCKAVMSWSLQLIQTNNQYHINHYEDHWHDSNGLRHLG